MAPNERRQADVPRPIESARDAWESGERAINEGWAQAQEFWNSVARSWGEAVGLWAGQPPWAQRRDGAAALRDVQEAALGVAQAWLRLPLAFVSPSVLTDFQRAVAHLVDANARAFPLWPQAPGRPADARR